jgi:hypothetical protein
MNCFLRTLLSLHRRYSGPGPNMGTRKIPKCLTGEVRDPSPKTVVLRAGGAPAIGTVLSFTGQLHSGQEAFPGIWGFSCGKEGMCTAKLSP